MRRAPFGGSRSRLARLARPNLFADVHNGVAREQRLEPVGLAGVGAGTLGAPTDHIALPGEEWDQKPLKRIASAALGCCR